MSTAAAAAGADGAGPSSRAVVPVEAADVDLRVHPSGIVPQLQNVVATIDLGCKLDLKEIALQARNAEYNPKVGCTIPCCTMQQHMSRQHSCVLVACCVQRCSSCGFEVQSFCLPACAPCSSFAALF